MNEADAKKQIENMKRFIEQEAKEKAEEILDQTNQELEAWKNEFKHNKRTYWKNYYLAEKKRREVAGKIAESKLKYSEDERVMKERQNIMNKLKQQAKESLASAITSKPSQYKTLLEDLIVEGLLKIMEAKVTVRATKKDQAVVKGLLKSAQKRFTDEMKKACTTYKTTFQMDTIVEMDSTPLKDSWYVFLV
eukprot:CAMPEP_0170166594 /NCGR_PEP_ID=MMETSP0040_2-20121228/241_1 /TAXON_ID=641309 /ORGANISM="Lotharella oceanica, Strain CCMP622" /LENGTH=191 /DNA_ID=CAMNT_0010404355 /DNA_START=38 /DNA_END=613 /DNA_ORIENTATION=+